MGIENVKKDLLCHMQIDAGQTTRMVQDDIKTDKISKQYAYDTSGELSKPTINVQKEV